MSRWQRRVDDLLYEGESVRESIDVGTARVVVTSHRVLAFTPEMDGQHFRQVERPNVDGIETSALAEADLLERGIRSGIIGGVLIAVGVVFDFESIAGGTNFQDANVDEFGLGGMMSMAQNMMNLLANLDSLLRTFGILALFLSVVMLGVYWYLRTPTLVIEVAGDGEDIHVPRPEDVEGIRNRLERAILPDPVGPSEDVEVPDDEVPADPLAAEADGILGSLTGLFGDDSPTPPSDPPADVDTDGGETQRAQDTGAEPETTRQSNERAGWRDDL